MKYCNKCGDEREAGRQCKTCRDYAAKVNKQSRKREELAAEIKQDKGQKHVKSIQISINWYHSRTWGNCPRCSAFVTFRDGSTMSREGYGAGGCGYDKESTVIAAVFNDFLKYKLYGRRKGSKPYGMNVFKKGDKWTPSYSGGVGTSCYYAVSDYIGGRFENTESGKRFDVFKYTDKRTPGRKLPGAADPFGALKGIMAMGQILCDKPEEKNAFNKRMLATVPGIDFPNNWDTLTEEEKTRRLEGAKEVLK